MITLSEKAVVKIKEFAKDECVAQSIRVKVLGSGCSGFSFDMMFEETFNSQSDIVIEQDGVKILVDELSLQYLEGSTIDYIESEFASGFKFIVPGSTGSCGCGQSYSF